MQDNMKSSGDDDDLQINIKNAHEVEYWCDKLGVTVDWLKAAVAKAGSKVGDVKHWLSRNQRQARGK